VPSWTATSAAERSPSAVCREHVILQPVRGHDAANEVLEAADDHGAELIVIGLRRRTPVGKLIMGSTAQRILLEASCPVLAVKAGTEG
jgi:nucleotide-binding universal stress UspA family protein